MTSVDIDRKRAEEIEREFDAEMRFRPLPRATAWFVAAMLLALSAFHYYTAGFGLLREQTHRGIHMAFVIGLIFLVFAADRKRAGERSAPSLLRPGGVPIYDWLLWAGAIVASLYIPWIFDDLAFRVGNAETIDVVLGSILILCLLEATRRTMGWPLVVIAVAFMLYAIYGRSMPGILVHPGTTWSQLVDHLYLTSQGIYGIPIGVVATYVFHFVLFGVVAMRVGLGRLFLAVAMWAAGRFVGGPAKVAIFGSALFGMISGSSVANAVTVGSLTIPMMKRLGYKPHFAAGVEATASTGGQITPPVMGAAAFLMIEFLSTPYQTIILAAAVPAFMHFFGVFVQVHFEAKRTGMRGLAPEELPDVRKILREDWITILPLVALLYKLFDGSTPYLAAFWGITGCILIGLGRPAIVGWRKGGAQRATQALRDAGADLLDGFQVGAKYALAVGAAAATIGIIIGVVTLTGTALKFATIIVGVATDFTAWTQPFLSMFDAKSVLLFYTLLMTGVVCILMGCGVPTTANYIIMVTIAAPALGLLGVQPIVAHFFVFYYGVLADVTPPVAVAAYAAASMAGADPFRTGNTAFRLALAKVMVPFVFVFSPVLLLVLPGFSWTEFAITFAGCIVGIVFLGAACSAYMLAPMVGWERWWLAICSLPTIAPGWQSTAIGILAATPVVVRQFIAWRRASTAPAPAT